MMRSLGLYLKSKKENAYPETVQVLAGLEENAEQLISGTHLDRKEISDTFQAALASFKAVKLKIASRPGFSAAQMDELKSVILSIEWEITDTTLCNFETVINALISKQKPNSIYHSFLKIMLGIGRYIGDKKADAHTDSVSFLHATFNDFAAIVQSPGMSVDQKKQIFKDRINRFKAFKQLISRSSATVSPSAYDGGVQPALSHIKQRVEDRAETPEPGLIEMPDTDGEAISPDDLEDLAPALTGRRVPDATDPVYRDSVSTDKDVMDDLFTAKETPADELLDAIHLMDVHGSQDHALKMLDRAEEDKANGIKKFTPQRGNTEPIPEIGNRLDEFFDLDSSKDPGSGQPSDQEIEAEPVKDISADPGKIHEDSDESGLIPFEDEDESIAQSQTGPENETLAPASDSQSPGTENQPLETSGADTDETGIQTLESFLAKPGWDKDRWSLQSIQKESFVLKEQWSDDVRANRLLDVILSLSRALETHTDQAPLEESPALTDKTLQSDGFFGWLRRLFSSKKS